MLPARNRKDLEDVPEAARNTVKFVWLEQVDDAVAAALHPPGEHDDVSATVTQEESPSRRAARAI
jgi:ATP-dependent Lon protease